MSERLMTCTVCPNSCELKVALGPEDEIISIKGFKCKRGVGFARAEITAPVRTLTAVVQLEGGEFSMCPVRTDRPIPREFLRKIAHLAKDIKIKAPVSIGDIIVRNILATGANLVITRDIGAKK